MQEIKAALAAAFESLLHEAIGIVIVREGWRVELLYRSGRWSASTTLEDVGDDVAHGVEEWGDTPYEAIMACIAAAEAASGDGE